MKSVQQPSPDQQVWLDRVDTLIGGLVEVGEIEEVSVHDVINAGWDWQQAFADHAFNVWSAFETTYEYLNFIN